MRHKAVEEIMRERERWNLINLIEFKSKRNATRLRKGMENNLITFLYDASNQIRYDKVFNSLKA